MFIVLVVLTTISYFFGKRNLLSPWFLLCLMFTATYLIVLLNYNKWDVQINGKFVLYITTAIVAFGMGCMLVRFIKKPYPISDKAGQCNVGDDRIIKNKYPVKLFLILSVLLTGIYIFKLMVDAGLNGSFTTVLRRIYTMQSGEGYSPGVIYNQFREVLTAIAYLNTFRLLVRLNNKSDKISIIELIIPIIFFLILVMVSTERNFFLRYAIYFACMWVFIYSHKYTGKNLNLNIIFKAALMLIVVVFLFFLLGITKQYTSKFFDQISIYCSSGLNNFNLWIEDFNESLLYGKSTFTTFLDSLGAILSPLGVELGGSVEQIDPFINYTTANGYHYYTNIYSALKPFVEDFGYFGVILFPFIVGALYQWLYLKAKRSSFGFSWIIYAMLIYPIVYFPILEQLFRRLHFGFIYEIGWLAILFYIIYGKRKTKLQHKNSDTALGAQ